LVSTGRVNQKMSYCLSKKLSRSKNAPRSKSSMMMRIRSKKSTMTVTSRAIVLSRTMEVALPALRVSVLIRRCWKSRLFKIWLAVGRKLIGEFSARAWIGRLRLGIFTRKIERKILKFRDHGMEKILIRRDNIQKYGDSKIKKS
jgi:hypothetical protein